MYDYQNLVQYNIPLQRVTKVYINQKIMITNFWVGDDNGIGAKTRKNKSVVDYLLLSSQ